jgi:hypothetical protein
MMPMLRTLVRSVVMSTATSSVIPSLASDAVVLGQRPEPLGHSGHARG